MTKFKLFIVSTILFTASCYAQTKQNVIGTWKFKEYYKENELKLDTTMKKYLISMFSDMELVFNTNNTYFFSGANKEERGTWGYLEKTKKIKITSNEKRVNEMKIIEFTDNSLAIELMSMRIVFKRKL